MIGQADVVERPTAQGSGLCDAEVEMGASALCAESCEIDPRSGETSCTSDRLTMADGNATIHVDGLHEVELTVTVCQREGRVFRVVGDNGASISFEGRALRVLAAAEAEASPYENATYLSDDEGCEERTLLLQTGRMTLAETGQRLCSDHLVPVDGEWAMEISATSLRSVELCFREG